MLECLINAIGDVFQRCEWYIKALAGGFSQHQIVGCAVFLFDLKLIAAQFVAGAKVRSKQNNGLFAIGIAAFPTRPRIGIWAIHIGDNNISPVDAFNVLDKYLVCSHGPLLKLLR